jgi:putative ABC transport system permease protein
VYGVLAYSVARRHREIGVRMALGAGRREVVSLVVRDAARAVVPGVVFGIVGAVLLTRTMRTMLYGVGTSDPKAFVGGLAALGVVAAIACVIPARRASRVDPMAAMRSD